MTGIFITFLLFVFTRLILFRSPWDYVEPVYPGGGIGGYGVIKLNPPKVKNHTPVKGKPKSNLPKKSG